MQLEDRTSSPLFCKSRTFAGNWRPFASSPCAAPTSSHHTLQRCTFTYSGFSLLSFPPGPNSRPSSSRVMVFRPAPWPESLERTASVNFYSTYRIPRRMLTEALNFYDDLWARRDKRVDGWLLMSGPMPTVAMCLSYVYIVKVWGPNFMRDRKPYNIRSFLIVYNAFQVVLSGWMFYHILKYGWANGYSLICQPVDYSDSPEAVWMAHMVWWYYFSKLIDFVDSFAFVAQKKFTHVSFLHVFHHGFMPFNVWWYARWLGGGHYTFMGLLNTFVHVCMYFYYMIAAMGPQYSKYIWWKRHITNMQLVQFVVVFIHDSQVIFQKDCDVPWQPAAYISLFAVFFFLLFSNFYIQAYLKKSKERKEKNDRNGNVKAELTKQKAS